MEDYKCLICGDTFKGLWKIAMHIRRHGLTTKEYYDKFLKKEGDGVCKSCRNIKTFKQTWFDNIRDGYREFCSSDCSNSHWETKRKMQHTCFKKYGKRNVFMVSKVKEKIKDTVLEKYGVENISMTEENRELKRLYRIRQIEQQKLNGEPLTPNISVNERECLNWIEEKLQVPIFRNFRCIGYFIDGYVPDYSISIEFDEDAHYVCGKLKQPDVIRQNKLEEKLACRFLRVRENLYIRNKK